MSKDGLPTPGVSSVGAGGQPGRHIASKAEARADGVVGQRPPSMGEKGRRTRRGEEVLRPELVGGEGRRIDTGGRTPSGVNSVAKDVIEAPLSSRARSLRSTIAYKSCDGREYCFRIPSSEADRKRELPMVMIALALRESGLGGDPFVVYDAFGFHLKDLNDLQVYPIERTIGDMLSRQVASPAPEAEPSIEMGFQVADDDQQDAGMHG